jgi:hypothetical protein
LRIREERFYIQVTGMEIQGIDQSVAIIYVIQEGWKQLAMRWSEDSTQKGERSFLAQQGE